MGSPVRCPPGPGSSSSAKRTPRCSPSPRPRPSRSFRRTSSDDPDAAGDATRLIRSSQVVEYVRSSLERYNAEHPGSSTRIRTW